MLLPPHLLQLRVYSQCSHLVNVSSDLKSVKVFLNDIWRNASFKSRGKEIEYLFDAAA